MIDLQKEFRTLRLLAWALLIIGAGLTIGGFGIALMTRDTSKPARVDRSDTSPESTEEPEDSRPRTPARSGTQKLGTYTSQIGFNTGLMGLLFIGLGYALRWIIRNNIDDPEGDGEVAMSGDLFKAYAEQLVLSEKLKKKNQKKMRLD